MSEMPETIKVQLKQSAHVIAQDLSISFHHARVMYDAVGRIGKLEAKVAELEALVREVYLIQPSWGNDALMVERSCAEWLIDAHRLCPPTTQEDQQ